jgi:hypothetical protein
MATLAIRYEKQNESQASRMCGAACLSMVYGSLGKNTPQEEIWPAISKPGPLGGLASTTHLMAQDAVNRGFKVVVIQARHPLQVLRLCREWGIRAILNHSLQKGSPTGHYSVLVGLNEGDVVLHDPLFGPSRHLSHAEVLALWQPQAANSEILGNVLIGIASDAPTKPECEFCHTPMPKRVDCPRCQTPVGLVPGALMGCMRDGCIARMWNYLCCPACDCMWTFTLQPGELPPESPNTESAVAPKPPTTATDPWKLDRLLGELNKFRGYVLSLPAAANHPQIRQQLDFIAGSKERLKLAQAEEFARLKARHDKLDARIEAMKQRAEERHKKIEERNSPLPPLDGDALARALLKNLATSDRS